ncbi:MAG: SusC/RagA family TonB-linked outer membrane protein [Chryseobacterium sp.]|nr:MAG: SusC/RagA family TonB-linked outer membrane protein [Chryseobacterium sp.]
MNLRVRALGIGALFFVGGQVAMAQNVQRDTTTTREIDEVVIVGYTAVKKEDYTGSVSTVKSEAIDRKNVSNVAQALTGEAAGVRVITSTGQPGSEPRIRVRGIGSVSGNREPLYVLDGVPYDGNISSINPEDIESMSVLKDATATAIYGARGANGVVLINTKRGRANRPLITVESKVGFNTPLLPRYDVIKSPEEYIALAWESVYNQGKLTNNANPTAYANANLFGGKGISPKYNMWNATAAQLIDPATGQVRAGVTRKYNPENWEDYAFQTSSRMENNLSISGGEGKTTYYTGLGYLKDEGYSINSKYERYSGRLNVGYQARPWLKGEFNMGYAYSNTNRNGQTEDSGSIFWFVDNIPSIYPLFLRDAQGNMVADPYFGGFQYDYGTGRGFGALTNAIADATYNLDNRKRHELNSNFSLKADLAKGLSLETRIGGQYYNNSRNDYSNPYYGSAASMNGSLYKVRGELFSWNFLQLLRYMNRFDNHGIQVFAAHETTDWRYNYLSASKYGLVIPDGTEFNNAINQSPAYSYVNNYALESYFGQMMYDYQNKYLLSASVRRDGSSRFLQDKWDTFYSVGLGWVMKRENFLMNSEFVNQLKLKASYGTVGDQAGVGFYPGYNVYWPGNFMGLPGAAFDRIGYPDLTWEKSKNFSAGIEFGLFSNRAIEGSVDYFHRTTENLIFDRRLAPSTGNAIIKVNDGLLVNQGVEFALTGHLFRKGDFFLDLSVNGDWLKNELTRMPIDPTTGQQKLIDLSEAGFGRTTGRSLYDYYMREWAGVNSQTGAAQWTLHYVDKNGNGVFDSGDIAVASLYEYQQANPGAVISQTVTETYAQATQKFLGKSALPDLRGAFGLNAGYKAFSIGAQFLYSIGGYAYDSAYAVLMNNDQIGGNNWHKDIEQRWQNPGDVTNVPRLSNGRDTNYNSRSSRFLTKADYLVLNNAYVAYSLPSKYYEGLGLNGLQISVTGDNLWINTKRKGFNPTVSETGGTSMYTYSPLSTITFGVKANF